MFVDAYIPTQEIANGVPAIRNQFIGRHFDVGLRRPYYDKYDRPCVTVNTGRWTVEKGERKPLRERRFVRDLILAGQLPPVFNATALRKEEWIELDTAVLRAGRYRLQLWSDLMANQPYGGFNGMSKMILEHETMNDPGEAIVDMNGLTEGRGDQPLFQLEGLPLPITHCDFHTDARKQAISRNTGTPFDVTMGEAAGRRVAESIEKTSIGIRTGITYGGLSSHYGGYGRTSQVYGMTNFTTRLTKTNITAPTSGSWVPTTLLNEVLACLDQLKAAKMFGPYMMYTTNDWDRYLDADYFYALTSGAVAPTKTLRNRLREIEGIKDVKRLDMWFGSTTNANNQVITNTATYGPGGDVDATLKAYSFAIVQMTPDVIRAVNGMDITTTQWETVGGMQINFKVMAIQVPQVRADYYGNCGILHATTS